MPNKKATSDSARAQLLLGSCEDAIGQVLETEGDGEDAKRTIGDPTGDVDFHCSWSIRIFAIFVVVANGIFLFSNVFSWPLYGLVLLASLFAVLDACGPELAGLEDWEEATRKRKVA